MATALVVVQPFASYAVGDRITDPDTVAALVRSHDYNVVKITVPDPAPAPSPAKS